VGRQADPYRGREGVRRARRPARHRVRPGRRLNPGRRHMANTWQGEFPHENLQLAG